MVCCNGRHDDWSSANDAVQLVTLGCLPECPPGHKCRLIYARCLSCGRETPTTEAPGPGETVELRVVHADSCLAALAGRAPMGSVS